MKCLGGRGKVLGYFDHLHLPKLAMLIDSFKEYCWEQGK